MIGNEIILSSNPKGQREGCVVSGTPKPGTIMEIKQTTGRTSGNLTYQAWSKATGAYGGVAVLLVDQLQGRTADDAYVSGTLGEVYYPIPGENVNVRVANAGGSAEDANVGDLFGVTTATGLLIHNSAYAYPCFTAIEDQASVGAEYLLACKFNG